MKFVILDFKRQYFSRPIAMMDTIIDITIANHGGKKDVGEMVCEHDGEIVPNDVRTLLDAYLNDVITLKRLLEFAVVRDLLVAGPKRRRPEVGSSSSSFDDAAVRALDVECDTEMVVEDEIKYGLLRSTDPQHPVRGFLVDRSGEVAGFIAADIPMSGICKIVSVEIIDAFRGKGHCNTLFSKFLTYLHNAWKVTRIKLVNDGGEAACKCYLKSGWHGNIETSDCKYAPGHLSRLESQNAVKIF